MTAPRARKPTLPPTAQTIFEEIATLPITSPHGHCDPQWFAEDTPFPDPANLLITPDHYVFRMLYSLGERLEDLGVGQDPATINSRAVFRRFARHWPAFLGTPTRFWMEYTLHETIGVDTVLSTETADAVYDQIADWLGQAGHRPRSLLKAFNVETLATTDPADSTLPHHAALAGTAIEGIVLPTFRPDAVINPEKPGFGDAVARLGAVADTDVSSFDGYLSALRHQRATFRRRGATATDHDVSVLMTDWLPPATRERFFGKAMAGTLEAADAHRFHGHMLTEMAQMSVEDGLVMQIHAGSRRSTNAPLGARFGADKGADIPTAISWVTGLDTLLNRVGNDPRFRLIAFTLDESTYARELAPMAGHWPALRIGPPWWFHDSLNGIRRFFDAVVETAGYRNLAGFNDDTRAFLSIPARHDLWRRGVALHLSDQIDRGVLSMAEARVIAPALARDLAREAYRLDAP